MDFGEPLDVDPLVSARDSQGIVTAMIPLPIAAGIYIGGGALLLILIVIIIVLFLRR